MVPVVSKSVPVINTVEAKTQLCKLLKQLFMLQLPYLFHGHFVCLKWENYNVLIAFALDILLYVLFIFIYVQVAVLIFGILNCVFYIVVFSVYSAFFYIVESLDLLP